MQYLIPILLIGILLYALLTKRDVYSAFVNGGKQSISLSVSIFPFLVAVFILINLLKLSGIDIVIANLVSPLFNLIGIPSELSYLVVLRPLSGSGSIAILNEVFTTYGADSYIGRCASVIAGSSDTVFYLSSIYFSQSSVKKLGIALPIALLCCFLSALLSCLFCRLF